MVVRQEQRGNGDKLERDGDKHLNLRRPLKRDFVLYKMISSRVTVSTHLGLPKRNKRSEQRKEVSRRLAYIFDQFC